jgi:hypothetical protein
MTRNPESGRTPIRRRPNGRVADHGGSIRYDRPQFEIRFVTPRSLSVCDNITVPFDLKICKRTFEGMVDLIQVKPVSDT